MPKMSRKMVSIIIPVYNAEAYLEGCLQSVFAQTYRPIEVICINDGSTDQSLSILNTFQNTYPDLLQIKTIPNGGQANARNIGMDTAGGDYLMFVDSDDTLKVNMVEELCHEMESSQSDLVLCAIKRVFEGKSNFLEKAFSYDTPLSFEGVKTIYDCPEIICYITAAPFAKLIRRQFLIEHQIRFIKGYIYEDLVFTQSLLAANPRIVLINKPLYNYLVRDNSTMTSKRSNISDMFVAYKNLYAAYETHHRVAAFKRELDFLCLYHVMIGTSYRMWRSNQYHLFASIKTCRAYCQSYQCARHNAYIREKGIIARLFLRLFYRA